MSVRIACICNMNNAFFSLVRYLRSKNYDADLLLLNELEHFSPDADVFEDDYKDYTHQLDWPNVEFAAIDPARIKSDLAPYDFVIGCGYAPAYLAKAGLKLDLFFPYGSDFYEVPFKGSKLKLSLNPWQMRTNYVIWKKFNDLFWCQFNGIKTAQNVLTLDPPVIDEEDLKKFGRKFNKDMGFAIIPLLFIPYYENYLANELVKSNKYFPRFQEIRNRFDLMIFNQERQSWKNPVDEWSGKASDVLIRGFGSFVSANPNANAGLILLEYGSDVAASKELIAELGIVNEVVWLPKMERKELMIGVAFSDICAGLFKSIWPANGSMGEFLSMGKPIIRHHVKPTKMYEDIYPYLEAETPKQISSRIDEYMGNRERINEEAKAGKIWLQDYVFNRTLLKIESMLDSN
jgi:hypothetical protein